MGLLLREGEGRESLPSSSPRSKPILRLYERGEKRERKGEEGRKGVEKDGGMGGKEKGKDGRKEEGEGIGERRGLEPPSDMSGYGAASFCNSVTLQSA